MPATTNAREWAHALQIYGKARRNKTQPEIINRAAGNACAKAISPTPRAKLGTPPLSAAYDPDRGGVKTKDRFYYAIAANQGERKGKGIADKARKIYRGRRSAKGAIAAGFIRPAQQFGQIANARAVKEKKVGGTVGKSFAKVASRRTMDAMSTNMVDGANPVARDAMASALGKVATDMKDWAIKKIQADQDRALLKSFSKVGRVFG